MSDVIAALPGDGIGPEVMDAGRARARARCRVEVEVVRLPFGGAAIDASGDPLPAETLEACRAARAVLLGAVGGPTLGRRRRAARAGPARAAQGARRLREPAPGDAGRRRPPDRARARRRPLLRRARRARRRHGLRHVRVPPGPGRAHRAPRLRAGAQPPPVARVGRQGERARHLPDVAPGRRRDRARLSRCRAAPRARRQLRDGARHRSGDVRRARDGEHVRRHPLRRRRRASPAGSGSPRRRASATTAPGSSSRCTARRPTSPAPATANPAAMLRSLALLLEHALSAPTSPSRWSRPSTPRSSRRRPPISAATPRPSPSATRCSQSLMEVAPR